MGLKLFGKKKRLPEGPTVAIKVERRDIPLTFRAVDVVLAVRWVDENGNEQLTSDVLSEEPQELEEHQYEIALGMLHIVTARLNRVLFRARNPSGVLPTPQSDPSQFPNYEDPAVPDELMDVAPEEVEETFKAIHDHPCSDEGCVECYQVTKKVSSS